MKVVLLVIAVFGITSATMQRSLVDEADAILRLLPMDDYFAILNERLTDPEVQTVIIFLQGDEWAGLLERISEKQAWKDIKDWITERDLLIDYLILLVREIISVIEIPNTTQDLGGFRSFVDAFKAVTPYDELGALIDEMIRDGGDMAELIDILRRTEIQDLFEEIVADDTAQYAIGQLKSYGINVEGIRDAIYSFLNWSSFIQV